MVEGNWETGIFEKYDRVFSDYSESKISADVNPLQLSVKEKAHPWNLLKFAIGGGGLFGSFALSSLWDPLLYPAIISTGVGTWKAMAIAKVKNTILDKAKSELDQAVCDIVDLDIDDVRTTHIDVLQTHGDAGFLSNYDTVHYLTSFAPASTPAASPQSITTRLTRTEIETYTDSQGKQQTRQRTVEVFNGLFIELEIPYAENENRIVLTSRRTHNMSGIFERMKFSKRQRQQDIKTSSLEFNRIFKVSSDDPTLGHEFMDPDRVMRLINMHKDLAGILKKKKVPMSILITNGKMYIALETGKSPKGHSFSTDKNSVRKEMNILSRQAMIPHVIAMHLKLPSPIPYAWQDHIVSES